MKGMDVKVERVVDAKKAYDKFFDVMVKLNKFYYKNYNAAINFKERNHIIMNNDSYSSVVYIIFRIYV